MRSIATRIGVVALVALLGLAAVTGAMEVHMDDAARDFLLEAQQGHLGMEANATATISANLFNKITNTIVPLINQYAKQIVVPGESTKHFSFNTFKLSNFNLKSITVGFAAPNKLVVKVNELSLAVPKTHFSVFTKMIVKISCSGDFWASLTNTNMQVVLSVSTNPSNGHLSFKTESSSVSFGSLSINHKFSNFFCKVAQSIVQAFTGNIDGLIKKIVQKSFPEMLGPAITKALNSALSRVPFSFVGSPTIGSNAITVVVDLIKSQSLTAAAHDDSKSNSNSSHDVITVATPFDAAPTMGPHDITLSIAQPSLNVLFAWYQGRGRLNKNTTIPPNKFNTSAFAVVLPALYQRCPNCPMGADFVFLGPPVASLSSQAVMVATTNLLLELVAISPALGLEGSGNVVQLLTLALNLTAGVTDLGIVPAANGTSSVMFHLNVSSFTMDLYRSQVGPVDVHAIGPVIAYLLEDVLAPIFNALFPGVPLPPVFANAAVEVQGGVFALGINLALPAP